MVLKIAFFILFLTIANQGVTGYGRPRYGGNVKGRGYKHGIQGSHGNNHGHEGGDYYTEDYYANTDNGFGNRPSSESGQVGPGRPDGVHGGGDSGHGGGYSGDYSNDASDEWESENGGGSGSDGDRPVRPGVGYGGGPSGGNPGHLNGGYGGGHGGSGNGWDGSDGEPGASGGRNGPGEYLGAHGGEGSPGGAPGKPCRPINGNAQALETTTGAPFRWGIWSNWTTGPESAGISEDEKDAVVATLDVTAAVKVASVMGNAVKNAAKAVSVLMLQKIKRNLPLGLSGDSSSVNAFHRNNLT